MRHAETACCAAEPANVVEDADNCEERLHLDLMYVLGTDYCVCREEWRLARPSLQSVLVWKSAA